MRQLSPGMRELRRRVLVLTELADELGPLSWPSAVTLLREIAERAGRIARLASDLATEITNQAKENGYSGGGAG